MPRVPVVTNKNGRNAWKMQGCERGLSVVVPMDHLGGMWQILQPRNHRDSNLPQLFRQCTWLRRKHGYRVPARCQADGKIAGTNLGSGAPVEHSIRKQNAHVFETRQVLNHLQNLALRQRLIAF